ncbi:MAG: hypothetical protein F4204_09170 [Rhodospirillaceae bacterium]|nr:hypothetical protein [Rhodospirillaceae bacterium]
MTRGIAVLALTAFLVLPAAAHFPDRCAAPMDAYAVASVTHKGRAEAIRRMAERGAEPRELVAVLKRLAEADRMLSIALPDLVLCIEGV